jgi:hypothetical protein
MMLEIRSAPFDGQGVSAARCRFFGGGKLHVAQN